MLDVVHILTLLLCLFCFFILIQAKFLSQTQINGEFLHLMTNRPDITSNECILV